MASNKQVKIYKGVEDNVKKASTAEPKIATDSIVEAFASFGLKAPKSELLYWSNQPTSKVSKMLDELKKEKEEKKDKFKESYQRIMTMAPLSDKEIYAIYDEYGLERPNTDWVRKNLPNDEEKLRKYLDIERDFKNKAYKKELSNKLKADQMANPGMVQSVGQQVLPSDGTGAANILSDSMGQEEEEVVPYHLSGLSLCRVSGDNTIWLIDSSKGIIKPFTSKNAFINFFKGKSNNLDRVAAAQDAIKDITVKQFNSLMKKYKLSSNKYGIKEDGQGGAEDAFYVNTNDISNNYGSTINETTLDKSISFVLAFLELFYEAGALSYQTYNKVKTDGDLMSLYAEAFTTGGYNAEDIFMDIKSRELKNAGTIDSNISNVSVISPTVKKDEYQNSSDYSIAQSSPQLAVPSSIKTSYSSDYLSLPLFNLPDNAFEVISPISDPTSEEFKTAAAEIKTTYNDILKMKLEAETDAQRDYAEKVWQDYKKNLEKTYNLKLSDNATDAWDAINSYFNTAASAGVMNSGIMNETIDNYLNKVREKNSRIREEELNTEEAKEAEYYRSEASPAQIQALYVADTQSGLPQSEWKSIKYGLVPSDDVKAEFSVENLKKKFPDLTDDEINKYISKIFDENGNFRSTKYSTLYTNLDTIDTNSAQLREEAVLQKAEDAEQKARDEMVFSTPSTSEQQTSPSQATTSKDNTSITPTIATPEASTTQTQNQSTQSNQQQSTTSNTSTPQSSSAALVISRNLSPGSSGEDVKQLQNWLISQGYNISAGATGYYGEQTKSAVESWQKANNIDTKGNYGYFGPISRDYVSSGSTSTQKNTTQVDSGQKTETTNYTDAAKAASDISKQNNTTETQKTTVSQPSSTSQTKTSVTTPTSTSSTSTSSTSPAAGYNAAADYATMSEEQKRKTLLEIISKLQNK